MTKGRENEGNGGDKKDIIMANLSKVTKHTVKLTEK